MVAGLHGPQYTAPFGDAFKLTQYSLFHQLRQLIDNEGSLVGVFIARQSPLIIDNQLDRQSSAYRLLGGGGDGFVEGIGVQAVAVVIDGNQRLQGGTDVVEVHLLGMQ